MRKPVKKIKRVLEPDPKFGSVLVTKIINFVMRNGKKALARKIVYKALDIASQQLKKNPLEIIEVALKNTAPLLEVKARRIGGATYQVPQEVRGERKITLALRWIIEAAKKSKGKSMDKKLAAEFINAFNNTGSAVKKRQDMHKMAEANRAFAHLIR